MVKFMLYYWTMIKVDIVDLLIQPLAFDETCAAHNALRPPRHPGPFDRGLVSHAILDGMTIVTPDAAMAHYPAPFLW